MDMLIVLRRLDELECALQQLYADFTRWFSADEKAAAFFYRMALDEKAHSDLVKYQERIVRKSPREFGPIDVNIDGIKAATAEINVFRATSPTIKQAIEFMLRIENNVSESYAATIMSQSNPEFADFLKGLADTQNGHAMEASTFAASYLSGR